MSNSKYTTKVTRLQTGYGCRIYYDGILILEAHAPTQMLIGPTFRDLRRTLDKSFGGDEFTAAAISRKFKPDNLGAQVKHIWNRT